jgi:two-component system, OmpR family, response regulator
VGKIYKVLIVEDDAAVQQVFDTVLADAGYELLLARDGTSMRGALAAGAVDVVIIDVMLPGRENGLALAREAEERGCGVILVTGHHDRYGEVEQSGYRHLFKPFRMNALTRLVEEALGDHVTLAALPD